MKTNQALNISAIALTFILSNCSASKDSPNNTEINLSNQRQASQYAQPIDVIQKKSTQKVKPNILWILTDDQRADSIAAVNLALRGTKESELGYVESPNLDALAEEGVLFPLAYNQSP
ncbi:hypothetical protein RS130_01925 [Paraglaciecola aquimarina]|uniref:Uncharacterized protein n=1 Tax=Paraglaciecola aquimarina TaxID=1235557 RepID=A0ABU3SS58_9ALTE|nr:hypothetical protein [Paraglaciecola aquimarina]MDU0352843.1 hypothetical protein [Paraglaciecola aquimarina]